MTKTITELERELAKLSAEIQELKKQPCPLEEGKEVPLKFNYNKFKDFWYSGAPATIPSTIQVVGDQIILRMSPPGWDIMKLAQCIVKAMENKTD